MNEAGENENFEEVFKVPEEAAIWIEQTEEKKRWLEQGRCSFISSQEEDWFYF